MDSSTWCLPPVAATTAPVAVVCGSGPHAAPVVEWATAGLPVVLPLAALPLAVQVEFAAREGILPLDRRVSLLLAGDRRAEAFALAIRVPHPLGAQGRLELELAAWAAAERVRLGLPSGGSGTVLVVGEDPRGAAAGDIRGALTEVTELLSPLPWPRWAGPVVVYLDGTARGIPTGGTIRPALPLLQITPGPHLRGVAAERLARLAFELSAPPAVGWPPWLTIGAGAAAQAVATGEGLSPRALGAIRTTAGVTGIVALVSAEVPDQALAKAVVGLLLSPSRRASFASFLDLLRQGASSTGALRVAYGLDPQALAR